MAAEYAAARVAAYASPASRASAAQLAAQLVASAPRGGGGSVAALNDGTDILCAAFPALDPPVVRTVLKQHAADAAALLTALCELAGEPPPPRSHLPSAPRRGARSGCAAERRGEGGSADACALVFVTRSCAPRARAAEAEAAAAAEEFDAELSLALALSVSEHEYATRGGAHAPPQQQQPALPPALPPPPRAQPQAPSRPLPPLPLQTWQQPPPRDAGLRRDTYGGGGRGRGRGGRGGSHAFIQPRPFVPFFPADATASRGWMPAWLPDGRVVPMPPPPPPQRPPPPPQPQLPPEPSPQLPPVLPPPPPPPPPPSWLPPVPIPVALEEEPPSSPAALLRELFPDLPLDMESLVATLGPEEATRICFEIMAADDSVDGASSGDGEFGGVGGGDEAMGVTEQLGVLQGYFPDAPLEGLFAALSAADGSLDGAIAALFEAESAAQAAAEQQAADAATAPPSGKEKEKVAQLRHAYPGVDKELLLAVLRAAHGSHRGAVAKLEQMGLESGANGNGFAAAAAAASGASDGGRGRAGRFAAAAAAAASAPPPRRGGGFTGSGERREWRGRFPGGSAQREGPSYAELRREATAHYDAVRRAVVAAGHAAELGDYSGAAKHQAAAREAKAAAEAANAAASALTLATRNAGNHSRVTRDLHALHVAEALAEVQRWIGFVATTHSGGTMTLQFVTGRGAHSAQGAKILPAVEEYLASRGIPWVRTNAGGCVEVAVDETLRQTLLARADATLQAAPPRLQAHVGDAAAGPSRFDAIKRGGEF